MFKLIKRLIFVGIIVAIWFFSVLLSGNSQEEKSIFIIEKGEGVNAISSNLHEANLIKNKFVFETWLWINKLESKVLAGTYYFSSDVSIKNLTNIITQGSENTQTSLTMLEGWDRNLLSKYLEEFNFSKDEFLKLTSSKTSWEEDYAFLQDASSNASLEGYIFPDTYYIDSQTSLDDIIIKSLNNFDNKLDKELRDEIDKQDKTIFEVITLASIIEREVPQDEDKKMIADIFLKRLRDGIGLQSDATINFITNKGMAQPTYEDLKIDSLYNTYKYRGLTPGPISNPGLSSIKAVIYPISNEYYYFLTTEDSTVIYSKTYEEHLENKAKYLD